MWYPDQNQYQVLPESLQGETNPVANVEEHSIAKTLLEIVIPAGMVFSLSGLFGLKNTNTKLGIVLGIVFRTGMYMCFRSQEKQSQ